jgi:hypothetical protein
MPRIIVTTNPAQPAGDAPVLLDEQVHSVHLSTGHAAAQLIERVAWAIGDAEDAERARPGAPSPAPERTPRPRAPRPRGRLPVRA